MEQTSQEIKQRKRMIVCFEIFALLFSRGSGAVSFHAYVSVLLRVHIFKMFLLYAINVLNRGLKSDCVGRSALAVLQQTLHIWTLTK